MSETVTFDMEVETSRPPDEFVRLLFEGVGVQPDIQLFEGIFDITTEFFRITAFAGGRDSTSYDLGLNPTVFVEFRPKPTLDTDIIAIKRLLTAINIWMGMGDNNASLIYNGETVMMYRKDGKLFINEACMAWTEARLALITVPYELINVPPVDQAAE